MLQTLAGSKYKKFITTLLSVRVKFVQGECNPYCLKPIMAIQMKKNASQQTRVHAYINHSCSFKQTHKKEDIQYSTVKVAGCLS